MIHCSDGVKLVKNNVKTIRLEVEQREYDGESHNVIAELPGKKEEWIVLTAHYDTTSLSHGAYDNMSGCAGLLGIMEYMKDKERNYGLRFVFCGSEERGLLGSKAYVEDHEAELEKIVFNINLDMIGTYMGKFIACASEEEKLANYISYMAAETGFPVAAETGVYSSDSTPFADKGIPAVSFARLAGGTVAPIHCRYDVKEVMSMEQLQKDIDFLILFTDRFTNAAVCPVKREIPEDVKKQLDEYLFRKRKEAEKESSDSDHEPDTTVLSYLVFSWKRAPAAFFSMEINRLTSYYLQSILSVKKSQRISLLRNKEEQRKNEEKNV